ncbi:MAG: UvrD-helicase domain-containing protein, partial [Gammaproteobacteria bacterium]
MNNRADSAAHTASSPQHNAIVMASAGTGKTWLLVTRIIRLLLAGTRPDAILAISFTRKAAMEMQTRLAQRLFEFVHCTDAALDLHLENIGVEPTPQQRRQARDLYESLLRSEQPPRITTFHAFCQDLLRRFPLEADVPPGFELLEKTAEIERSAQARLFMEATADPDGKPAQALDLLFSNCGAGAQNALSEFLQQRSDWWAFTEGQANPARFAEAVLAAQLTIDHDADYLKEFFCAQTHKDIAEFIEFLKQHSTATNTHHAELLAGCLGNDEKILQDFLNVKTAFLTDEGKPRSRKASKAQAQFLGEDGQQRFLELHEKLCAGIQIFLEQQARVATYRTNCAWYVSGVRLLDHYQQIKADQRLLDFADLEWKACQLLNHSDNAEWVQYKLDQRIDHLLVDEFQDTNPTQWNLLLPLLNELAAGTGLSSTASQPETERNRSAFIVGDGKQSIYRFRRAEPRLLDTAQAFLNENLNASSHHLAESWRSAPAVIEFINQAFAEGPLYDRLHVFETHTTHHHELYGRVEILPLIGVPPTSNLAGEAVDVFSFRNPLQQPRLLDEENRHYEEGKLIAKKIKTLLHDATAIGHAHETRPLNYSDIFILLR